MRGIGTTGQHGECIRIELLGGLKVRAGQRTLGSPDIGGARPRRVLLALLPMLHHAIALGEAPLLPEEPNSDWLDEVRRTHNENVRRNLVAAAIKVASRPSASWSRSFSQEAGVA